MFLQHERMPPSHLEILETLQPGMIRTTLAGYGSTLLSCTTVLGAPVAEELLAMVPAAVGGRLVVPAAVEVSFRQNVKCTMTLLLTDCFFRLFLEGGDGGGGCGGGGCGGGGCGG